MPNPLLESDILECLHKGKVLLQSSTKDLMCVQDSNNNDAGLISLQDLANAVIIGCANNIAGIPNSICSTLLEIDNQKIVLAQAISQVLTDKGSPLILQDEPKAKDIFEIDEDITEFNNAQNTNDSEKPSVDSNADSSKSNAKSNANLSNESSAKSSTNSNKDSQTQKEQMVLEVMRKWEYRGGGDTNADNWATTSEFKLKLDDEIIKDSNNQEIKGYIVEPAAINPNRIGHNLSPEEQQKIAKSDTRIPAGEYEVFWKKSNIESPALMIENPNNKETYLNDLQKTIRSLGINIEQLSCNIVSCKHNKDDRKTFGTKHIHIVPQLKLKGKNNSVIGKNRDGILIHYGDTGEWSTGCLLPANELRWTKEKWIAKDRDSTINAIARLYIALIQHDTEAFKIMHLVRIIWQKAQLKNLLFKLKKTIGLNPIHLRSNNAFNNLYVFYY